MGMVYIKHPTGTSLGGPVPQEAFDNLWSKMGWEIAPEDEVEAHELALALGPVDDNVAVVEGDEGPEVVEISDQMTREQLDEIATARGLNPSDYKNKADLLSALNA